MENLPKVEMKVISHRANISGPNPLFENHPDNIDKCIKFGYDVEVDVRLIDDSFYLGHDSPDYCVTIEWIHERKDNLWIHCKDLNSLDKFSAEQSDFNYFWHQEDDYTLTSRGFIWTYPGKKVSNSRGVLVMPEWNGCVENLNKYDCYAVCTDYICDLI